MLSKQSHFLKKRVEPLVQNFTGRTKKSHGIRVTLIIFPITGIIFGLITWKLIDKENVKLKLTEL